VIKVFISLEKFEEEGKTAEKIARSVFNLLKIKDKGVEINLVSNEEMAKLNSTYKKKEGPTNILSFPAKKGFPRPEIKFDSLGEIYLAPDYLKNNQDDVKLLIIHGILHLLGYNHKEREETIEMEQKEEEILKELE